MHSLFSHFLHLLLCFVLTLTVLFTQNLHAQSDTINQTDSLGRKQGFWRYTVAMVSPTNPTPYRDSIARYGYYIDDRKEGVWTNNTFNGELYSRVTYVNDTVNGPLIKYGKGGIAVESMTIKGSVIVGDHFYYEVDSNGVNVPHRRGGVEGTVTKGKKLVGPCRIYLMPRKRDYLSTDLSTTTDSSGHYAFYDLAPGLYDLRCAHEGADRMDELIEIKYDDTLVQNFSMQPDYSDQPAPVACLGVNLGLWPTAELRFGLISIGNGPDKFLLQSDEFTVGSEVNFRKGDFILTPKLNYTRTYIFFFFGAHYGASLNYATDFDRGTFYLQPHLGFQLLFILDVAVGYNIPLGPQQTYFRDRVSGIVLSGTIRFYNFDRFN